MQVAPAELEGHLLAHRNVADAAVIGVPDEYAGELPSAFIVLQQDIACAIKLRPDCLEVVRTGIYQVSSGLFALSMQSTHALLLSMLANQCPSINGWTVGFSLLTAFHGTLVERF